MVILIVNRYVHLCERLLTCLLRIDVQMHNETLLSLLYSELCIRDSDERKKEQIVTPLEKRIKLIKRTSAYQQRRPSHQRSRV